MGNEFPFVAVLEIHSSAPAPHVVGLRRLFRLYRGSIILPRKLSQATRFLCQIKVQVIPKASRQQQAHLFELSLKSPLQQNVGTPCESTRNPIPLGCGKLCSCLVAGSLDWATEQYLPALRPAQPDLFCHLCQHSVGRAMRVMVFEGLIADITSTNRSLAHFKISGSVKLP